MCCKLVVTIRQFIYSVSRSVNLVGNSGSDGKSSCLQAVLAVELKKLDTEDSATILPSPSNGPEAVGAPGTPSAQK